MTLSSLTNDHLYDVHLHAHAAVPGHIEDHEEVTDLLTVQLVWLSLLILEQSGAQGGELVDVDGLVPWKNTSIITLPSVQS